MLGYRIQLSAMVFLALGVVVVVLSAVDFGVSGIWDQGRTFALVRSSETSKFW